MRSAQETRRRGAEIAKRKRADRHDQALLREIQTEIRPHSEVFRVMLDRHAEGARVVALFGRKPGNQHRTRIFSVKHDILAALASGVGGAEESAAGIQLGLLPAELPESLHRYAARQTDGREHGRRRHERLLQFRARRANGGHVDRQEGVDAALNEEAFAPVHDLLADANIQRHARDVEISVNESIENIEASAAEIARLVAARRIDEGTAAEPVVPCTEFFIHPVIVERLGADECAVIPPLEIEVGRDLDACGVRIPLIGIDVAVIVIDAHSGAVSGRTASVRLRNERTILFGGPEPGADRNQIVDLEIGFPELEFDGMSRSDGQQHCRTRHAAQKHFLGNSSFHGAILLDPRWLH